MSGKKETTTGQKEADDYLKETSSGSFTRTFRIPGEVEEENVEASYKDGVLTLVLPRKEASKTKKIESH